MTQLIRSRTPAGSVPRRGRNATGAPAPRPLSRHRQSPRDRKAVPWLHHHWLHVWLTCVGRASAAATSNAYAAGVATGSANTAAATSAAYGAGVATGAAIASAPLPGANLIGVSYASLPVGSTTINKNGTTNYLNGNAWFQPSYDANGIYYSLRASAIE